MRSLAIIATLLTFPGAAHASENRLEPDPRRCARVVPTLVGSDVAGRGGDDTASADRPLLYKAVEHRINGCPLLLMHTGELRRIPEVGQRRNLWVPAR